MTSRRSPKIVRRRDQSPPAQPESTASRRSPRIVCCRDQSPDQRECCEHHLEEAGGEERAPPPSPDDHQGREPSTLLLRTPPASPPGRVDAIGVKSSDEDTSSDDDSSETQRVPAYNFSFALGGWLMIYNFGVAKCLLDHGLHKVQPERQSIIGSSAGSLAAAGLVLEADIDKIVEQAKTSFIPRAHAAKSFGFVYGMFFIGTFLKESMLECLPVHRVPEKKFPRARLIVVMTSLLGWNSIRVKEFEDGDDLFDALRCSCAVFPLVMPHRFRGKRCLDGFFSEGTSSPVLNKEEARGLKTVTISPLYASSASIRPSRYVPLSWIALPPRDLGAIDWLYDLGYRDALFWMAKEGIEHTCSHDHRFSKVGNNLAGSLAQRTTKGSDSAPKKKDDSILGAGKLMSGGGGLWASAGELPSPSTSGDKARGDASKPSGSEISREGESGAAEHATSGSRGGSDGAEAKMPKSGTIGNHYVRTSFVLSGCRMRPRRERHPQLDESVFVPSLEQFVGHGSYHAALDFFFVIFFNVVWRPAAALLLYADLIARLVFVVSRGVAKELRPLLWWVVPVLLLSVAAHEHGPPNLRESLIALAGIVALVVARAHREGSPSDVEWKKARHYIRGLVDGRILFRCLPWGRRDNMRSEALEANSFLQRAVSFFM